MANVILLPQLMNLEEYLDMRMMTVRGVLHLESLFSDTNLGLCQSMGRHHQAIPLTFLPSGSHECCPHDSVSHGSY